MLRTTPFHRLILRGRWGINPGKGFSVEMARSGRTVLPESPDTLSGELIPIRFQRNTGNPVNLATRLLHRGPSLHSPLPHRWSGTHPTPPAHWPSRRLCSPIGELV